MRENPVRSSVAWIMRRARFVQLDGAKLSRLAGRLQDMEIPAWEGYHFRGEEELSLRYLLVLDSLNFCFWPDRLWSVLGPNGERLTGYFALAYALRRAAEVSKDFFEPHSLIGTSEDKLREVLGEIPLLRWRTRATQEVGHALLKFGSATRFFSAAHSSCQRLVELLTAHFPSFRDAAVYQGREVLFHKRAQILCADLYGAFSGEGPGELWDLEWLTAFADYKLPQILRAEGVLLFRPELAGRIDRLELIPAGSSEEVELRAATVAAVEELAFQSGKLGRPLRAFEVDWLLWHLGQAPLPFPHHRTLTCFY
jgi:hypothetical protein